MRVALIFYYIIMRFTVSSTALSSKLAALSRVINSKSSLPILGDFVFDVASDGTLHAGEVESIIQETGQTATDKTSVVRKVVNSRKVAQTSTVEVFTDSITLQSEESYAERGHHQQAQIQKEGYNAQRGRCKACHAVFRTIWSGGGHERVQRREGDVFRPDPRMVRYRWRSAKLLLGEEKTGSGGCWRAGAENQSDVGRCAGKEWNLYQPIEHDDWEQCKCTLLFIYTNKTGGSH